MLLRITVRSTNQAAYTMEFFDPDLARDMMHLIASGSVTVEGSAPSTPASDASAPVHRESEGPEGPTNFPKRQRTRQCCSQTQRPTSRLRSTVATSIPWAICVGWSWLLTLLSCTWGLRECRPMSWQASLTLPAGPNPPTSSKPSGTPLGRSSVGLSAWGTQATTRSLPRVERLSSEKTASSSSQPWSTYPRTKGSPTARTRPTSSSDPARRHELCERPDTCAIEGGTRYNPLVSTRRIS